MLRKILFYARTLHTHVIRMHARMHGIKLTKNE